MATSMTADLAPEAHGSVALDAALATVASGAATRDADPARSFPGDAFAVLAPTGVLAFNANPGEPRPTAAEELGIVRRVAAVDGSVGRILDGHLNAVERLAVFASGGLRDAELDAIRAGALLAGVWGGQPGPGEGQPASLARTETGEVLWGAKTFCSGAGGLQRAAVLAVDPSASAPVLVWVDLTDERQIEIDTGWYRSAGLTASASHRVVFHDAPVLTRLGAPGAISLQPWFGRDALRTAASWAGMADAAVASALAELAQRETTELEALAAGRMLAAQGSIGAWLAVGAAAMDAAAADLGDVALYGRAAIAGACRVILDEAARACGSHPFAHGGRLDRARRDLELFLLQHRLDPMLARAGRGAIEAERR